MGDSEEDSRDRGPAGWELFSPAMHLPVIERYAYYGFVVIGGLLISLSFLSVLVELWTRPSMRRSSIAVGIACAGTAAVHVFMQARSARRLTRVTWLVFIAAIGLMCWEVTNAIIDPTARVALLLCTIIGGLWFVVARVIVTGSSDRPRRTPRALWVALAILSWSPPFALLLLI